jgi:two-component system, chemotaxis family, CheB/CheR fusion protein
MQMLEIEALKTIWIIWKYIPNEFVQLFNTILINVTEFFSDPDTWELIDTGRSYQRS